MYRILRRVVTSKTLGFSYAAARLSPMPEVTRQQVHRTMTAVVPLANSSFVGLSNWAKPEAEARVAIRKPCTKIPTAVNSSGA